MNNIIFCSYCYSNKSSDECSKCNILKKILQVNSQDESVKCEENDNNITNL